MYVRLKKIVCTNEYNCKVSGREEYDCGRGQQPHCLGNILLLCCILLSPFRACGKCRDNVLIRFASVVLFIFLSERRGRKRKKLYF